MGLFQKAVETYDAHRDLVGQEKEGHQILAPWGHVVKQSDLEIVLELNGRFASARLVEKNEPKIIIPATEESAGRSGKKPKNHPLCDYISYIAPYDREKHIGYVTDLTEWATSPYSHPMLPAILAYVKGGTILSDLVGCGLIELNEKGQPKDEKTEKLLVRWRVLGIHTPNDGCWQQPSLWKAFQDWIVSRQEGTKALCMISGVEAVPAKQHQKGVVPLHGNAKLISTNDHTNFTFRGRFTEESQAVTVASKVSQKAHNALNWLVEEQGRYTAGGRVFLCWNPQGVSICHALGPFSASSQATTIPSDYRKELKATLQGYRSQLPAETLGVVIAAFDAATTGRLAVTYYNELTCSDFLQRLYNWDTHCCWYGRDEQIQSPLLRQIVNCAFGTLSKGKTGTVRLITDDARMGQQLQRLLSCRIDGARMPSDIMRALVHRASAPQSYTQGIWETILSTACAVIRKYRYDYYKEECTMEFDPYWPERSYQFGCLLAVLEKVERDTYGNEEQREPNAIRLMSMYCRRPMTTFDTVHKQLVAAYFPRLKPPFRAYYRNRIGEIMDTIHAVSPEKEWNAPLKETYLMGYYLQRKDLKTKHTDSEGNPERTGTKEEK